MSLFEQQDDWFFSQVAKKKPSDVFRAQGRIIAEDLSPGFRTLNEEWTRAKELVDNFFGSRDQNPDDVTRGRGIAEFVTQAFYMPIEITLGQTRQALSEIESLRPRLDDFAAQLEKPPSAESQIEEGQRQRQAAIDAGLISSGWDGGESTPMHERGPAYVAIGNAEEAIAALNSQIEKIKAAYHDIGLPTSDAEFLDKLSSSVDEIRKEIDQFKGLMRDVASGRSTFKPSDMVLAMNSIMAKVATASGKVSAAEAALAVSVNGHNADFYDSVLEHSISSARTASEAYERARDAYIRDLMRMGYSPATAKAGMDATYGSGLWDETWKDPVARKRAAEFAARIFDKSPEARRIRREHEDITRTNPEAAAGAAAAHRGTHDWIRGLNSESLNRLAEQYADLSGMMREGAEGRSREGSLDTTMQHELAAIKREMLKPGADIAALEARAREVFSSGIERAKKKMEEMMRQQGASDDVIEFARSRDFKPLSTDEFLRLSRIPEGSMSAEERRAYEFHSHLRNGAYYRGLVNATEAVRTILAAKDLEPAIARARAVMLDTTKSLTERVEALEVALGSDEKAKQFAAQLNDDGRLRAVYMDAMRRAEERSKLPPPHNEKYEDALANELAVLRDPEEFKRRAEDRGVIARYDAEVVRELGKYRAVGDYAHAMTIDSGVASEMSAYLSASMGVLHPEIRSTIEKYKAGTIGIDDLRSALGGQYYQQAIIDGATLKRSVLSHFQAADPDKYKLLMTYLEKQGINPKDDKSLAQLDIANLRGMPDPAKRSEWTPEETALAQFAAYSSGAARMLEIARGIAQDAKNGSYLIDKIYDPANDVRIPGTSALDMQATVENRMRLLEKFNLIQDPRDKELVGRLLQLDKGAATDLLGRLAKAADMPGGEAKETAFRGIMLDTYIAMRPAHERPDLEKARMEAGTDPVEMQKLTTRLASTMQFETDTMMQIQQRMRQDAAAAVYGSDFRAPPELKPEQVATWELGRLEAYKKAYQAQVDTLPHRLLKLYESDKAKYAFLKPIYDENQAIFNANRRPGLLGRDDRAAALADQATLRRLGFVAGTDDAVVQAIDAEIKKKTAELEAIDRKAAEAVAIRTPIIAGATLPGMDRYDPPSDLGILPAHGSREKFKSDQELERRRYKADEYLKDIQKVAKGGRTEIRDGAREHFITDEMIRLGKVYPKATQEELRAHVTATVSRVMSEVEAAGITTIKPEELVAKFQVHDQSFRAPVVATAANLPELPDAHNAWIRQRVKDSNADIQAILAQAKIPPMPSVVSAAIASEEAIKAVQARAQGDAVARPPLTAEQLLQSAQFKAETLGKAADQQITALATMMKLPEGEVQQFRQALARGDVAALGPYRDRLLKAMKENTGELLAANALIPADRAALGNVAANEVARSVIANELLKSVVDVSRELSVARTEVLGRGAQAALQNDPALLSVAARPDAEMVDAPGRQAREEARKVVAAAREQSIQDRMAEMARSEPALNGSQRRQAAEIAVDKELAVMRTRHEGQAALATLESKPEKLTLAARPDSALPEGAAREAAMRERDAARGLVMKAREELIHKRSEEIAKAEPGLDRAAQMSRAAALVDRELAETLARSSAPKGKDGQPVVDAKALVAAQERVLSMVREQIEKRPDANYHKPAIHPAEAQALNQIRQRVAAMDPDTIRQAREAAARIRENVHLYKDPLTADKARDVELARQLAFKEAADARLAQGAERSPGARVEYSVALAAGREAERSVEQSIRGRNAIIAIEQHPELRDLAQRDQSKLRGPELQRSREAADVVRLAEQQREIMLNAKIRELKSSPDGQVLSEAEVRQQAQRAVKTEIDAMVAKATTGGAVVSVTAVRGIEFAALGAQIGMPANGNALGKSAAELAEEEARKKKEAERRREEAKREEERAAQVREKEVAGVVASETAAKKPEPVRVAEPGKGTATKPAPLAGEHRLASADTPRLAGAPVMPAVRGAPGDLPTTGHVVPISSVPDGRRADAAGGEPKLETPVRSGGVLASLDGFRKPGGCGPAEDCHDGVKVPAVPDKRVASTERGVPPRV